VHIRSKSAPQQMRGGNDEMFEFFFGQGGGMQPREGVGSGVIVRTDGYIVTNNHVVKGASELEVTLFDNKKYKATIVGTDPTTDLAVIKIDGSSLPILDLADSDEARVGEWVLAVGNPLNLTSTVTAGIVSAKGRNINLLDRNKAAIESFIQTDAAVNPGNSGGALVDVNGKLLGINVAIASETGRYEGYAFAIPANLVKKVAEDIIETGATRRGFLGVNIINMDSDIAKEKNLDIIRGVYVDRIVEGGAAERAGLKSGDVIVGVNSKPINTSAELQEIVGRGRPGDAYDVAVNRRGRVMNFNVKLTRGTTQE
jgi:serine protease Do